MPGNPWIGGSFPPSGKFVPRRSVDNVQLPPILVWKSPWLTEEEQSQTSNLVGPRRLEHGHGVPNMNYSVLKIFEYPREIEGLLAFLGEPSKIVKLRSRFLVHYKTITYTRGVEKCLKSRFAQNPWNCALVEPFNTDVPGLRRSFEAEAIPLHVEVEQVREGNSLEATLMIRQTLELIIGEIDPLLGRPRALCVGNGGDEEGVKEIRQVQ